MKEVAQTTRSVVSSGMQDTADFTILANGKAFQTLIDGLYANKIRAAVRELFSNAFDSHQEAGCGDRPFLCQVPSELDATFRVRDYGVSLTHEGVMQLYTTVFQSTKNDTNAQVGKLGLGSKSPFAYIDTFSVIAYLDGEKRIYVATINEENVPQINFLGGFDTDEENGLEISFPVKLSDVSEFQREIKRVAFGFDVKPVCTGVSDFDIDPLNGAEPLFSGEGWKLYASQTTRHLMSEGAYAKQGCVLYPIKAESLSNGEKYRDMLRSCLIVEFPIGEIDIAASREALSYDDVTRANVERRLEQAYVGIQERVKIVVPNTIHTPFDASNYAATQYKKLNSQTFISSLVKREFTWQGKTQSFETGIIINPRRKGTSQYNDELAIKTARMNYYTHSVLSGRERMARPSYSTYANNQRTVYPPTNNNFFLVFHNVEEHGNIRNVSARLRHFFDTKFVPEKEDEGCACLYIQYKDKRAVRQAIKYYGYPRNVFHLENMETPPRQKRVVDATVRSDRPVYESMSYEADGYFRTTNHYFPLNVEEDKEGFYIYGVRNEYRALPEKDASTLQAYEIKATIAEAVSLGIIDPSTDRIIVLRPPYQKAVMKAPGWKNLFEHVLDKTKDMEKKKLSRHVRKTMLEDDFEGLSCLCRSVKKNGLVVSLEIDGPVTGSALLELLVWYGNNDWHAVAEQEQEVSLYNANLAGLYNRAVNYLGKSRSDYPFLKDPNEASGEDEQQITAQLEAALNEFPMIRVALKADTYAFDSEEALTAMFEYINLSRNMQKEA